MPLAAETRSRAPRTPSGLESFNRRTLIGYEP
jgi:hypothetical protein